MNLLGFSVHGILLARILSGLPFPSPEDLPDPGSKLRYLALQANSLPSEPPRKSCKYYILMYIYMKSKKMILMIFLAGQQRRHRHEEQSFVTVGDKESGMT